MNNHASITAGITSTADRPRLRAVPDTPSASRQPVLRDRFDQLGTGLSTRYDIYARPDVYDMEYEGASNHDARFFARLLARVRPRRVLELACGSGRVTFTLAAALPMAEIVGVDSSVDMLGKAATARDAAEPSVRERVSLVEGDMREWPGTGDAFDAVVIACCSVSHLLTLDDRRRTWATAFRVLRPGGVFILDVRVPDLATLAEAQRVRPRAFVDLDIDATRRTAGEEARLLRCTATTYEPHLQRADVRLLYDRFDERALAERLVTDFASHVYFPAELELLFLSAGFEIAQQYGDYRFVRVDRTSPYVVTVARRPHRSGPSSGWAQSAQRPSAGKGRRAG
jgi:ubiquinone/menaquinone biosynthesis C-methylase UbiE